MVKKIDHGALYSMSLEKDYFESIYKKGELIDGEYNAKSHARYLFQLFHLVEAQIDSVADYGCGGGKLLYEVLKLFRPSRVYAMDSSQHIFNEISTKQWIKDWSVRLEKKELVQIEPPKKSYDLGICNSVLQYLEEENEKARSRSKK